MGTSPQATRKGEESETRVQFGIAAHKSDFRKISDSGARNEDHWDY